MSAPSAHRLRHLVLASATLLSTSACTMTHSTKTGVTVAGGLTAGAGLLMMAAGPEVVDSDGDGVNEWSLNDDYSGPLMGAVLLVVGAGVLLGGLTARTPPENPPLAISVAGAPGSGPAVVAARPPVRMPLPELPVDAETLRLAQQTRLIVMAGRCEPARDLLVQISVRAPAYHQALVAGPVLDNCPALR